MFGNNDVDKVLAKGKNFVDELDTAVTYAQGKSAVLQTQISDLLTEQKILQLKAKKGSIVSKRITKMLEVTSEELAGEELVPETDKKE